MALAPCVLCTVRPSRRQRWKESKIALGHILVARWGRRRYETISFSVQFRSRSINFPIRQHWHGHHPTVCTDGRLLWNREQTQHSGDSAEERQHKQPGPAIWRTQTDKASLHLRNDILHRLVSLGHPPDIFVAVRIPRGHQSGNHSADQNRLLWQINGRTCSANICPRIMNSNIIGVPITTRTDRNGQN